MNELGKPVVGLLPLMLEMYKKYSPYLIQKQKPFIDGIAKRLSKYSDVKTASVCATRSEVREAVGSFEKGNVDLLVIIYIAYATSISALGPLLDTNLPLLLFSTTPKSSMAEGMTMEDIMLNHGVHGYMDLANVLRRNGRPFLFTSGRFDGESAYDEIGFWARGARLTRILKDTRIGLGGYTFDGMGDFGIDTTMLNSVLGPELIHVPLTLLAERINEVEPGELVGEAEKDREMFTIGEGVDREILDQSNRVYLGLAKIVEDLSLNAFSMHFQGILENPQIKTLPFLAISKLQEQGLAYAGEGDLLGAAANLILRLLCGESIFTETFCPDFEGGRLVMGHMGESNPAFGKRTVLRRKKFVFGDAVDPVIADVEMQPGRATVLNLGIVEENEFQMVVYSGEICEKIPGSKDIDMPYFHFKPDLELSDFLSEYGLAGGTHHIAMTRGEKKEEIVKLAELLRVNSVVLM
jgi:L-arabinose isomerase